MLISNLFTLHISPTLSRNFANLVLGGRFDLLAERSSWGMRGTGKGKAWKAQEGSNI